MAEKPDRYGAPWTRDELILAFELYCRIPFRLTKANNPQVQNLAHALRRSPAGVARKLGNFGAFDPELQEQNISGLAHNSRLDKEIWDEFHSDWNGLTFEAHRLKDAITPRRKADKEKDLMFPAGPSERMQVVKQRIHQAFFREAILSSYESTCCVSGLRIPECLIASHIIPWSQSEALRTNPTNGLCLSATFDRLFDTGFLTISQELRVVVSKKLLRARDEKTDDLICRYHGQTIIPPHRFFPDPNHLAWHMENVFQG